jgi:hypothetical protein
MSLDGIATFLSKVWFHCELFQHGERRHPRSIDRSPNRRLRCLQAWPDLIDKVTLRGFKSLVHISWVGEGGHALLEPTHWLLFYSLRIIHMVNVFPRGMLGMLVFVICGCLVSRL